MSHEDQLIESAEMAVDENIDRQDLKRFEQTFVEQVKRGQPSCKASFDYAVALIKGTSNETKLGIKMFENLCQRDEEDIEKRSYIYYLAIANVRIRNYDQAQNYVRILLQHEPANQQAQGLRLLIQKRMKRDGLVGAAVVGGGALVVGGILAAIFAAARR